MKDNLKNLMKKGKWLRSTLLTILLMAIIVALCILINVIVEKQNIADIDLTKEKLYSLSQESKDKIKNITQDTKIILYGMSSYTEVMDYANLYNKENSHITYEELEEATTRPDLQLQYGLGTYATSLIIIETEGRTKAVMPSELYTYDYTTYEQLNITEQTLTNAILSVNLEKSPKIYFVTNHALYDGEYQALQEYLRNEANEVESLDLLVKGEVPADCDLLVITTLSEDFSEYERDLIVNYINTGKNIMILADPNYQGLDLTNFQSILDLYGASISNGILYESDMGKMISGYANIVIPGVSYTSDITKYIATDGTVAFMNAGEITYKSDEELESLGVTVENLITSSQTTFLREDMTLISASKTSSDIEAPEAIIGTVATKNLTTENEDHKESKLILFSNSMFASDMTVTLNGTSSNSNSTVMGISFYNNKDLIINSVSYATQRTDNITLRKDTGVITYTATEKEDTIIRAIIIALPVMIIVIGLMVWQIRRRKK
ncbi:MAG: Gldg family protein [Clostridia bacterium]